MEEMINLAVVERALAALAVLLPLAGLAAGLAWGATRGRGRSGALQGLIVGLSGPLVWLLWRAYNAIENHYGLDSVKALLLNLALFAAVGIVIGTSIQVFRCSGVQVFRTEKDRPS